MHHTGEAHLLHKERPPVHQERRAVPQLTALSDGGVWEGIADRRVGGGRGDMRRGRAMPEGRRLMEKNRGRACGNVSDAAGDSAGLHARPVTQDVGRG